MSGTPKPRRCWPFHVAQTAVVAGYLWFAGISIAAYCELAWKDLSIPDERIGALMFLTVGAVLLIGIGVLMAVVLYGLQERAHR